MDLPELLNEREWRRCQGPVDATIDQKVEAFTYFATKYWYIKHPERGRILFDLREAQTRYGPIPEVEALKGWLDILDPPPPPPADPTKPPELKKTLK